MTDEEVGTLPLPSIVEIDQAFWDGVQNGSLTLQKCLNCQRLQFFPRPVCVHCFSSNLGWQQSNGTGGIYSFTLVYVPQHPVARKQVESTGVPIIFALIDLDEGIRIVSEIVGCRPEEVELEARVKVSFEEVKGTNFELPKFRLVKSVV